MALTTYNACLHCSASHAPYHVIYRVPGINVLMPRPDVRATRSDAVEHSSVADRQTRLKNQAWRRKEACGVGVPNEHRAVCLAVFHVQQLRTKKTSQTKAKRAPTVYPPLPHSHARRSVLMTPPADTSALDRRAAHCMAMPCRNAAAGRTADVFVFKIHLPVRPTVRAPRAPVCMIGDRPNKIDVRLQTTL